MNTSATQENRAWWQSGVIYQIYPRSFQDSDGDGIGDLPGVTSRLEYLVDLGVDAIWLSPFYPSPMADFGYDVADLCNVDPIFGTLADFDMLVAAAHRHGLRVIVDFVPNHTSDQHPWFIDSRSSRGSAKRDWYIWNEGAPDGSPPNNWLSMFGGSAWTWDDETCQYYLHNFHAAQPDLNWRNPEVQRAMFDAMRFWLDRGIDGFRLDVVWMLIKDRRFRDNPTNPDWHPGMPFWAAQDFRYSQHRPEVHGIIRMMRKVVDEYADKVLIGELYATFDEQARFCGDYLDECHLPFNFWLITQTWSAGGIAVAIRDYEQSLPVGAWPNWVLGNHDQSRIASRIGADRARVAAMLLLTLRGTPTHYYGDELGMEDVEIAADRMVDLVGRATPELSRDPERTPMPWDSSPGYGFTSGQSWLPIGDQATTCNVACELETPDSMLALYRRLFALRRQEPALSAGDYGRVWAEGDVLVYERIDPETGHKLLVALNLGDIVAHITVDPSNGCDVLIGTHMPHEGVNIPGELTLDANEGVIVRLGNLE